MLCLCDIVIMLNAWLRILSMSCAECILRSYLLQLASLARHFLKPILSLAYGQLHAMANHNQNKLAYKEACIVYILLSPC